MTQKTVKIRLDGTNYEEVVCREISWNEDVKTIDSVRSKKINQETMKAEDYYDVDLLRYRRFYLMITEPQEKVSFDADKVKQISQLLRKDMTILANAWNELNEVTEEEKSGLVGDDSGGATPHEGSTDGSA